MQVRSNNCRLTGFASLLLNSKEEPRKDLGRDKIEQSIQSVVQEGVRFLSMQFL